MKKEIRLRPIDRWVIGLLAAVMAVGGLYLAGPWYLEFDNGKQGAVYYLTHNIYSVKVVGLAMLATAAGMIYSIRTEVARSLLLSSSLLAAFLLRTYTLIGSLLTLESWRPPNYISPLFTVALAGVLWIWVRRHEGTP